MSCYESDIDGLPSRSASLSGECLMPEEKSELERMLECFPGEGGISFEDSLLFNDYAGISAVSTYFATGYVPLIPDAEALRNLAGELMSAYNIGYSEAVDDDCKVSQFAYRKNEVNVSRLWDTAKIFSIIGPLTVAVDIAAITENPKSGDWNFLGFRHWLLGNGSDVSLSWSCFDKKYVDANRLLQMAYNDMFDVYRTIAKNLSVGMSSSSNTIAKLSTADMSSLYTPKSHNPWINLYVMSIFDGVATVTRTSKTSYSVSITAYMQCFDRADFNPGQSFGPWGMFHDDWFIPLAKAGYCNDYDQYAATYLTQSFSGICK